MKVAIVFNESQPEIYKQTYSTYKKELDFKPYFDLSYEDPIEGFEIIANSLKKSGFDVSIINIFDDIDIFLDEIKAFKPDVIMNFVEIYKNDAKLEMAFAGLIDLLGIPYTGATPFGLANCQRKTLTKRILKENGIPTPNFQFYQYKSKYIKSKLKYPLIVKPAFEDASVGIENESVVSNARQLKARIEFVFEKYSQSALVEEFIEGRELNVAVFGGNKAKVLPISEIDFSRMPDHLHNIVSYSAKWDPMKEEYHKTIPKCPAKLPKILLKNIENIALKAFSIMQCRDYARVDMRLNKNKEFFILEVNPNPDLTEGAGFMRSAKAAGYSFDIVLRKLIEFAWERRL